MTETRTRDERARDMLARAQPTVVLTDAALDAFDALVLADLRRERPDLHWRSLRNERDASGERLSAGGSGDDDGVEDAA